MASTLDLSARLATARLRDSRGTGALDVFAVAAFAVASALAFVVASGTWMFSARRLNPPAWLVRGDEPGLAEGATTAYLALAVFACALLILPVLGLGGAAARLGARGRARRLASLRLVGMTSGEVVGMSVVESLVQAAIGIVLGAGLWLASTPLLTMLTFQNQRIGFSELLMPWWLWLAIALVVLALAAVSTVLGLTRVRISPLGVAHQTTSPAMRAWRVLALVLGVVAVSSLGSIIQMEVRLVVIMLMFAGIMFFAIAMMNLFAPWVLQLLARIGSRTRSPARLIAMRRIVADPRSAWRNVSALGLIGFIVGLFSTLPIGEIQSNPDEAVMLADIRQGALLTFGIALLVGAAGTVLTQSSDVIDRADELVALDRMGVPRAVDAAARRHQVFLPLVVTLGTSMALGALAALPLVAQMDPVFAMGVSSLTIIGSVFLVALVLTLLAAESTRPLRNRALATVARRND